MYSDIHTDFILTPLFETFLDGVTSCAPLPVGIENRFMGEYFLQSLFLRMTGAQEQKMKCICWVLATNDHLYRYEYLNKKNYGECSDYGAKRDIYKDLVSIIKEFDSGFNPTSIFESIVLATGYEAAAEAEWKQRVDTYREKKVSTIIIRQESNGLVLSEEAKNRIRDSICNRPYPQDDFRKHLIEKKKAVFVRDLASRLIAELDESPISSWDKRGFLHFKEKFLDIINEKQLLLSLTDLFGSKLQNHYTKIVYDHRNRTAHNTLSYQKDLPTFSALSSDEYIYHNYYFRFGILLLLDEIFVLLFKRYRTLLLKNVT